MRSTSIFLTIMIFLLTGTLISRAEITNTTYQTVWDDAGALRVGGQVGDNTAGRFAKGDFSNEEIEAILRHANLITAQMNAEADVDALRTAGQFIPGVGSGVAFAEGDSIRGSSYFVRDVVLTVTGTKLLQSGKTLAGMTLRGTGLGAIQGGTSAGFDIGSDRATAAWNGESYSGTVGGDAWEMVKATRNGAAFGLVLGPVARVASLRAPPAAKTPLTPNPYAGVQEASAYLRAQGVPREVRKQVLESFDVRTIGVRQAGTAEYGLRYFDNVDAFAKGRYLFETFPSSRASLALDPQWNKMTNFTQWQIRPGATLLEGFASPQGGGLPGGQIQKFVPNLNDLLYP